MERKASNYRWLILLSNALLIVTLTSGNTTWAVAVEPLTKHFGLSATMIMLGGTAFVLGFIVSNGIWAYLTEKIGFKKVGFIGVTTCVIAQFLIPQMDSYALVLLFRFFQGFGVCSTVIFFIVGMWFPEKERGTAVGLIGAMFFGGFALGGLLVGFFEPMFGWQTTYTLIGVVGLIGEIQWLIITRLPREGETIPDDDQLDAPEVSIENGRVVSNRKSIWKSPAFYVLSLIYFADLFIAYSLADMTAVYFGASGYSITQVGILVSIAGWIGVVASPLGGFVSDMLSRKINKKSYVVRTWCMLLGGFLIAAIGCFITPAVGFSGFTASAICMVIACWGIPWMDCIGVATGIDLFGKERGDKAVGYVLLLGGVGGVISPVLTTWIGDTYGWTPVWILMGVICLVGVVGCYLLTRCKPDYEMISVQEVES